MRTIFRRRGLAGEDHAITPVERGLGHLGGTDVPIPYSAGEPREGFKALMH
jgi:hypothetical protein